MKGMKTLAMMMALATIAKEPERKRAASMPGQLRPLEPDVIPRPKGLKLLNIDGVEVWAINEKNARRKAKNKLVNT